MGEDEAAAARVNDVDIKDEPRMREIPGENMSEGKRHASGYDTNDLFLLNGGWIREEMEQGNYPG